MRIVLHAISILTVCLFLPFPSSGAETVKYRHLQSIYADGGGIALNSPEGVTCDNRERIIAADTAAGRLLTYTLQDNEAAAGAEIIIPQLTYPVRLALNSRNEIFVLDRTGPEIVHLGPGGEFMEYVRPSGLPGEKKYIVRSFAFDSSDNMYILDIFSERVIILDPDGEYTGQIDFPENYGFFSDVTVDFRGNVLLVDSVNAQVYIAARNAGEFTPLSEQLTNQTRYPTSITTDIRGRIYLVDKNGGRIAVIGQDGSYLGQIGERGWKEGLMRNPAQLCINDKGIAVIADTINNRIQIFEIFK